MMHFSTKAIATYFVLSTPSVFAETGAQYFANQAGIVVKLVPSDKPGHKLAAISGTRTHLDLRPLELALDKSDPKETFFKQTILGKDQFILSQKDGRSLRVIMPVGEGQTLYFNPKLSEKVDAASIKRQAYFLTGVTKGQAVKDVMKSAETKVERACKTKLNLNVSDHQTAHWPKDKDLVLMCADAVSGLEEVCSDHLGQLAIKKALNAVICTQGPASTVARSGKTLQISFAHDATSLAQQTTAYLEQNL